MSSMRERQRQLQELAQQLAAFCKSNRGRACLGAALLGVSLGTLRQQQLQQARRRKAAKRG